jgi:hypothetical protein
LYANTWRINSLWIYEYMVRFVCFKKITITQLAKQSGGG